MCLKTIQFFKGHSEKNFEGWEEQSDGGRGIRFYAHDHGREVSTLKHSNQSSKECKSRKQKQIQNIYEWFPESFFKKNFCLFNISFLTFQQNKIIIKKQCNFLTHSQSYFYK